MYPEECRCLAVSRTIDDDDDDDDDDDGGGGGGGSSSKFCKAGVGTLAAVLSSCTHDKQLESH